MRFKARRPIISLIAVAILGWTSAPALSQGNTDRPGTATKPAAKSVSDQEVDKYISAASKVAAIRQRHSDQTGKPADGTSDIEMQNELVQAVESEGLTVNRFNQIYLAALADEDLRKRIISRMEN